jgi:aminoglycoside 2'-N-acetyltransferase I
MPDLQTVATQELATADLAALRLFLDEGFDHDFPDEDWEHCLGGLHVMVRAGDDIICHAALIERELVAGDTRLRTGYVEGVATRPTSRGRGQGSRVMKAIAAIVHRDFELGALATGRPRFYARLGWEVWRGPTSVGSPGGCQPTPEDDGAVMILRTPATPPLDLDAQLMCDWRAGDVW